MALKFFHLQKSKTFNYTPRYFDPDQEERDDREQRIKAEMGIQEESDPNKPFRSNIKGQFRYAMGRTAKSSSEGRRSSNIRLVVFILILTLIVYLFFYA